ncbi:acyl-CoA dehydrogenase family protein [Virgibacillus siamensis]|uniref:acyl-CoA dehydrogenase family protein n=1 Tax=Virgibacillus siamensis TaxID=480071 RepID=UPI00098744BA|nr:acyl-CoA dehydrogenase family protein [Virgibacillus siamensis]
MVVKEETGITSTLDIVIQEKLKPFVRRIDTEAYYAEEYLTGLGEIGLLCSDGISTSELLEQELFVTEKTAQYCMTTAFNLWCHLASLTYLRNSSNVYLKKDILPSLEKGIFLGATGLSNPMKYYAGLEKLHLQAKRTDGGYVLTGNIPSVSNLKVNHWFAVVAALKEGQQVMAFVPCNAKGLTLKEKVGYMGVNGSATFACRFADVFIPDKWIISDSAAEFCENIRSTFVLYQVPLGLGVTNASIQSMKRAPQKQGGVNTFLSIQPEEIEQEYLLIKDRIAKLLEHNNLDWKEVLQIRLDIDKLTIKAVHGDMLHYGGAAYLQKSNSARRLREAYFLINLTPTEKHLEKLLATT